MKRAKAHLVLLSTLLGFLASGCSASRPDSGTVTVALTDDQESIRQHLLVYTPLQSDAEDVLLFVSRRLRHRNHTEPFYDKRNGAFRHLPGGGVPERTGSRSISVFMGEYGRRPSSFFLVSTHVYVDWAFGEDDRLVDIVVNKMEEGP